MGFFKEFKAFAMRGNVMDMAVGVVVGGAFSKIVTSLVNDVVMPALSLVTGRINLADLAYTMPATQAGEPIVLHYGQFLQNILDFVLIALSIFIVIRIINRFHKKKEEAPAPAPSREEVLLGEIRDLLQEKQAACAQDATDGERI
nr:large-conductance mechanosensitive channel protein MscL [Maliibacterium massiliense]